MILKGKSHKGKTSIREFGEKWEIICQRGTVDFSKKTGPWLYIKPLGSMSPDQALWIHQRDDFNFEIVKM